MASTNGNAATKANLPNKDLVLETLARHLIKQNKDITTTQELIRDQGKFNELIKSTRINWKSVADDLHCTREYVYHWYHETYLRSIQGENKIGKEDKKKIKDILITEIKEGLWTQPNMQQRIRQKVFGNKEINRSEFNIIYNNIKRSKDIQKLLQELRIEFPRTKGQQGSNNEFGQSSHGQHLQSQEYGSSQQIPYQQVQSQYNIIPVQKIEQNNYNFGFNLVTGMPDIGQNYYNPQQQIPYDSSLNELFRNRSQH